MRSPLHGENEALRAENARLREEARWAVQRQGLVEAELTHLARLRVASQRLHETLEPCELLEILKDLLVNLVGSETLGIFELEGTVLVLRESLGIDVGRFQELPLGEEPFGQVVRTGVSWWQEAAEAWPRACVPLRVGHHVLGLMVLFALLPHKPRLEMEDRELLELLATQGARALYCARSLAARGRS